MRRALPLLLMLLLPAVACAQVLMGIADPYLPATPETFETPYSLPTGGTTYTLTDADNLQTTINAASPGDVIVLTAGDTWTGSFTLPNKGVDSDWIYIVSSAVASLPEGTRVAPTDATDMPKIQTTNSSPALQTEFGSNHYRLVGIEIQATADIYNIVLLGFDGDSVTQPTATSDLPSYIWFDRCYVRSTDDAKYAVAGILGDGKYIAVFDSYIANIKAGPDAQAFVAWYGEGPYKIVNNFLEGAAENIMFGGEEVPITNSIPSDIEIRGNYCYKNPTWEGHPTWNVKNLLELKNAQRVAITGNVFENNWTDGQNGTAILFTTRNQDSGNEELSAPWSVVQDVLFENNHVLNTERGFNLLAEDNLQPSDYSRRIKITNNLVEAEKDFLTAFTVTNPLTRFTFSHNTLIQTVDVDATTALNLSTLPDDGVNYLICQDNIICFQQYGGLSSSILSAKANNATVENNGYVLNSAIADYAYWTTNFAGAYPNDIKANDITDVDFTNLAGGVYSLQATSPFYQAGSDGEDIGVNWSVLQSAISGVVP